MTRSLICSALASCAAALFVSDVRAQYYEVFSEAQVAGGISNSFLDSVAVSGGVAYAVSRDTSGADVGAVVSYDGSTFTTVMTPAQWTDFGSTNDIAASAGVGVVGDVLRTVNFFDNNVIQVDLGTGIVSEAVSAAAFNAASGFTAALIAVNETTADGTIYAVESTGDQLLVISPGNVVSVEISPTTFASILGGTSIGGIGVNGTTVYLGSNSNDSIVGWDTVTNTASTILDAATIDAMTDDVNGAVGFGDLFYAPDGLVYFYESQADFLMSFDPTNPAGSLAVVLTEAELLAGPGTDLLGQLAWWNGKIAWTDQSDGFYAIPEPTTALLSMIALAGFGAARRR